MSELPEIVDDPEGKWIAQCPKCQQSTDLESLGWTRTGAYSYGKRTMLKCPRCAERSFCRILHVDRYGRPDQPFSYVLGKALETQSNVWAGLATVAVVGYLIFRFGLRLIN